MLDVGCRLQKSLDWKILVHHLKEGVARVSVSHTTTSERFEVEGNQTPVKFRDPALSPRCLFWSCGWD
jgi:hypothetical protein